MLIGEGVLTKASIVLLWKFPRSGQIFSINNARNQISTQFCCQLDSVFAISEVLNYQSIIIFNNKEKKFKYDVRIKFERRDLDPYQGPNSKPGQTCKRPSAGPENRGGSEWVAALVFSLWAPPKGMRDWKNRKQRSAFACRRFRRQVSWERDQLGWFRTRFRVDLIFFSNGCVIVIRPAYDQVATKARRVD